MILGRPGRRTERRGELMAEPTPDREREALLDWLVAPPARWPDYFEDWRLQDVREVILHVITETATHAGHLDAARELIDGRTWMGPDDTRVARG
jgi:hypothetical protein